MSTAEADRLRADGIMNNSEYFLRQHDQMRVPALLNPAPEAEAEEEAKAQAVRTSDGLVVALLMIAGVHSCEHEA